MHYVAPCTAVNVDIIIFLAAGDNYLNATALVITFVVNNHLDEADNKKAEAWEKV